MKSLAPTLCADRPGADYESGLVRLARQTEIPCHLIGDLVWAEIDDESMFERALKLVYPAILSAQMYS
jgi:hypothetical protein